MEKKKPDDADSIAKAALKDALGLPPGDGASHGEGRPMMDPKIPHGTLTSDDPARRDGTPVEKNSGTDEWGAAHGTGATQQRPRRGRGR